MSVKKSSRKLLNYVLVMVVAWCTERGKNMCVCFFFYVVTKRLSLVHIYSVVVAIVLWFLFSFYLYRSMVWSLTCTSTFLLVVDCASGWKRLFMRRQSTFNMSVKWDYKHLSQHFSMFCVYFRYVIHILSSTYFQFMFHVEYILFDLFFVCYHVCALRLYIYFVVCISKWGIIFYSFLFHTIISLSSTIINLIVSNGIK